MAYIYDLSDAWSAAGTTFTAIKMNVTDTASAAGSLLMDLQVGGVSQSRVNKNGQGFLRGLNDFNPDLTLGPTASVGIGQYTNNGFFVRVAGDTALFVYNSGGDKRFNIGAGYHLGIGGSNTSEPDLKLFRDAANTLAQRNGVNAQAFNLYNTYTDASNYERGFMRFVSNTLEIGAEALGTGTVRTLRFFNTATTQLNMTVDPAGATVGLTRNGLNYIRATNTVGGSLALGTSISGGRVDSIVVTGTAVEIREDIVLMANLPTSNPAVAGQLWNDAGTLKVSAG